MAWAESMETSIAHPQPEGLLEGTTVTRGKARAAPLIPQHENKRATALQPSSEIPRAPPQNVPFSRSGVAS